jgi:hypothetical protein
MRAYVWYEWLLKMDFAVVVVAVEMLMLRAHDGRKGVELRVHDRLLCMQNVAALGALGLPVHVSVGMLLARAEALRCEPPAAWYCNMFRKPVLHLKTLHGLHAKHALLISVHHIITLSTASSSCRSS